METEPTEQRVQTHPILKIPTKRRLSFRWQNKILSAHEEEMISSALIANGIHVFGHHRKDGSPQGIFCANGQCSHCLVIADGLAVKACITPVREGMQVFPVEGLSNLTEDDSPAGEIEVPETSIDVLIVGAGPAGLNAALELARHGISVIVADDKHEIGGKLGLQTHNFFGSVRECRAGTRGIDIAEQFAQELKQFPNVHVWLDSPVVGVFVDGKLGIVRAGMYSLVKPKSFLVAAGAREKVLAFPGCDLPGVFGAGAFQTLVNRDLVKPSTRVFIVGGGNVGLIAAYHALQAGMRVVGLVEALPKVGGYKVHLDKIKRLGIPVFTSHTILKATGNEHVEKIIVAQIDSKFKPIAGTEHEFLVDTVLIAVGLNPVNELAQEGKRMGIPTYLAGDAELIAEASAAMFSGKVAARRMLQDMGKNVSIPTDWLEMLDVLRGRPGPIHEFKGHDSETAKVFPVIRCIQEIPCNPCVDSCPKGWIRLEGDAITSLPEWTEECVGCLKCAAICPGLAITVVDRRFDPTGETALVWVPWELDEKYVAIGAEVTLTGFEGEIVGSGIVRHIRTLKWMDRRKMVQIQVKPGIAHKVAGIRIQEPEQGTPLDPTWGRDNPRVLICFCERVDKESVRELVRMGVRDLNAIKAATRSGMGACGGKTCENLVKEVFREEGTPVESLTGYVNRPFTMEVPLRTLFREASH